MTKWLKSVTTTMVLGSLAVLVSCEWTGSGDDNSYNTSGYGWVNFSGVYRALAGVLVSDFTSSSTTATGGVTVVVVTGEVVATGNGANTVFGGLLNNNTIVSGSATFKVPGFGDFVDDGAGNLVNPSGSGTIDYGTGSWSIDLGGSPLGNGENIRANYTYTASSASSASSSKGNSGSAIFSLTVFQTGNKLEIRDNNGAVYTGRIGKLQTTGGIDASSPETAIPSIGDQAIAEFTVTGVSSAGAQVMIAGTLQGVVSRGAGEGSALFLSNRIIQGVWSETGGTTGDVSGTAAPISITVPTT